MEHSAMAVFRRHPLEIARLRVPQICVVALADFKDVVKIAALRPIYISRKCVSWYGPWRQQSMGCYGHAVEWSNQHLKRQSMCISLETS
jgi:hypothetical protein